jgi:predicted neuraminidase
MPGAQFLYNAVGSGLYCHGGSLFATADGDLLAAWYAYPELEHAGATLVVARRPRGADAWLPSETPIAPSAWSAGNPVLFAEPSGRIWLFFVLLEGAYWTDAVLHGACSDDAGRSWSRPTTLLPTRGMMVRHSPVQCADGEWLLPAYDERTNRATLLAARPPFTDWRVAHVFVDVPLIQPVLVREPDRLTLLFRPASDPRVVWRSHSTDEGRRWSPPMRTSLPNPLSGISALSVGSRLAVVYNHTERHERRPLSLAASDDGGRSWSEPRHIDDMAGELSYPSFVPTPDGTLHGVYTYNRRLIKYVQLDAGWLG